MKALSKPHPLLSKWQFHEYQPNQSLDDIVVSAQPDPVLRRFANVYLDNELIQRDRWKMVQPRIGQEVQIIATLGGGNSLLRTILSLSVLVVGTVFGGPLGGLIGLSGTWATAVGTALIAFGGTALVNAIAPIRPAAGREENRQSPNYFIDRARNRARLFEAVPVVLGKHRMVPPLAAETYTEAMGDRNYLRMMVCWGYGQLKITDLQIGETPIADFDDVHVQTREGTDADAAITLYPRDVHEESLSLHLTSAAGWISRTTEPDADEISIDIALPRGMSSIDDQGNRSSLSVVLEFEYRKVGDSAWLPTPHEEDVDPDDEINRDDPRRQTWPSEYDQEDIVHSATETAYQVTLSYRFTKAVREGFSWTTPERAQYQVRIRRTTADRTSDREFDDVYWSALRTFTNEDPVAIAQPVAKTAVEILGTDQVNGALDQLNAVVSSVVLDWDGTNWVERESSNPASLFRHVLQSPARINPVANANVDLETLQDWHEYCEDEGFEYNAIRDFRSSVYDALADVAAAGRASPSFSDGLWSVVIDDGAQLPAQHFSARNSVSFTAERDFSDVPHALRVRFANRDMGWRRDERLVYDDNRDPADSGSATYLPAERFLTIDAPGITDPDHIYKFGRFHLAQMLLRRERWRFEVGIENLAATRGTRVKLSHDIILVGQASARIKSVTEDSQGRATAIEIDEKVKMVTGVDYGVSIRTVDDVAVTAQVTTSAGETQSLDFSVPIPATTPIVQGNLLAFGEQGHETVDAIVVGIERRNEMSASVTLMPFSPGVYTSDTETIPDFYTGITSLAGRTDLVIVSVRSDESLLRREGTELVPGILVEVKPVSSPEAMIQCQIRANGTMENYRPAEIRSQSSEFIEIGGVIEGQDYDLRLRWASPNALIAGTWTEELDYTVVGKSLAPGLPTGFVVAALPGGYRAAWANPADIDFDAVCVYAGATAVLADASLIATVAADYYIQSGQVAGTAVNVWIRTKDTRAKLSAAVGPLSVTPTEPIAPEGTTILTGSGAPTLLDSSGNAYGTTGQIYIQANGVVWRRTDTAWVDTGVDITGTAGAKIYPAKVLFAAVVGTTPAWPPADSYGAQGDIVVNGGASTYPDPVTIWIKGATSWVVFMTARQGDAVFADDGNVWIRGEDSATHWEFLTDLTGDTGKDGRGAEFVFRRTAADVAPAAIVTTDAQKATDDFEPTNWSDDPLGTTTALPYEWVSKRKGSTEKWNEFSAPVLWSRLPETVSSVTTWPPANTFGKDGDTVVADDGQFGKKESGAWVLKGDLTGSPGSEIHEVDVYPPDNSVGKDGDVGFATSNGNYGYKSGGTWGAVAGDLTGPVGAEGPTGLTGIPGVTGGQGPAGAEGPTGLTGIPGVTGPQGEPGDPGAKGDTGIQGVTGPQGIQGGDGDAGDQGIQGVTGPQGPAGGEGPAGPAGSIGQSGNPGPAGQPGAQGDQVFKLYSNAPEDTDPATLVPLTLTSGGNWTTDSGYLFYADATQVPAN